MQQPWHAQEYGHFVSRKERKRKRRSIFGRRSGAHRYRGEKPRSHSRPQEVGAAFAAAVASQAEREIAASETPAPAGDALTAHTADRPPGPHAIADLVQALAPEDALLAYRFLAFLRSAPLEAGLRIYGDAPEEGDAAVWNPVVVLVGPCTGIASIGDLIVDLESSPHLRVSFRLFRDGFYRVDGHAADRVQLGEWLGARRDVQSVVDDASALHVRPVLEQP